MLEAIHSTATWIFWLAVVGVCGVYITLTMKVIIYLRVMDALDRVEALAVRSRRSLEYSIELLGVIKEWAFSGANRHKDAAAHLQKVVEMETAVPTRAELVEKLEKVPDVTAEKVVEKFKSDDSGIIGR